MTVQAAKAASVDHPAKKNTARQKKTDKEGRNALEALSEYSLSEFLENEPDLYSVSDLKVRYK
ncbi:MAG: hypothetical protein Q7T80_00610 [Methanoregula sp.]|nr:hypothetical protein [Methanoregula sp.]